MISHLRIVNVALIDQVEVSFGAGLNVLTGETGAGKSIVVDSINFMLGQRPGKDFVRSGADTASVEGIIEISDDKLLADLHALGVDNVSDGQLSLFRTLQAASGKSVCRVNGRIVTVGMLKEICGLLVDVHGQHEHQSLLDTNKQLQLLDQFCGSELSEHKSALEKLLTLYRDNNKALKALAGAGNGRASQLDIWQFQIDEIEKAKLKTDEEQALTAKRARLSSLEKLNHCAQKALGLLSSGDVSAVEQLGQALTLLHDIARLDTERAGLAKALSEALAVTTDIAGELRSYTEELDADPLELERVEARLDTIYRLKNKYNAATATEVLQHQAALQAQADKLINSEQEIKRLQAVKRQLTGQITDVCAKMTAIRKACAQGIQKSITAILHDLGMANAQFDIQIAQKAAFTPDGNDKAEFLISPNPGEPLKPLNRIASGGEMSRVMLAVKSVLAEADKIGCVIFDEVDAGVSGRTAQQVAEKLMGIGRGRQILCITHLPQIAAMADTHFLIQKETDGERTVTSVLPLEPQAMTQELARLIGGAEITQATIKAAGEMKELADKLKIRESRP
jgi:DNA repair protein RecN (Recombination protein N)